MKEEDAKLWEKMPFEQRIEVDLALGKGSKAEAVNHCMCANVGFTLLTAKGFVERRAAGLAKRDLPRTR
jgi:hypothetical protein